MLEAAACSTFIDMLKRGKELHRKLLLFLEGFLDVFPEDMAMMNHLPAAVLSATNRVQAVYKAFRCLLSPLHSADAPAVTELQKYKGGSAWEKLTSDIINHNDFYKRLWDDVLVKGAGTVSAMKTLTEWQQKLGGAEHMDVLPSVVEELPKMRKQTRPGATAGVEDILHDKVIAVAKGLLDDGIQGRTLGFINMILKGLHLFADRSGVLALASKVEKARTQAMSLLSLEELRQQMRLYEINDDGSWPKPVPDLAKSLSALQACADIPWDMTLNSSLMAALYWHYRQLCSSSDVFVEVSCIG